jgi:chorismate dehydratase
LASKIKVGAVSYLNTKPLLYGIQHSDIINEIDLIVDYPARLAAMLSNNEIDMALLPVAAMQSIKDARIVSNYGIAADGNVASVALYSQVPLEDIKVVYLDYQSRTSVRLVQVLFKEHWKKDVEFRPATEHYIEYINNTSAGVIIGDRALQQLNSFEYIYDLADAWKEYTGLPFVFAAWIANKELPQSFLDAFDRANAEGLQHIDEVVAENPFPYYDLKTYFTENIHYYLDERKRQGLNRFLEIIKQD